MAALSGLLLVGAFPHLDWGWLAWGALVPLLLTFPQRRLRGALAHTLVFGLVYFGGLIGWIGLLSIRVIGPALGVVAWLIASASQTLFLLVWAAGALWLRKGGNAWAWRLGVPALWTVLEWLREKFILGSSWGDLGYTQHAALPVLQLAKWTGVWGLTFLIVLVNVAVADFLRGRWPSSGGARQQEAARRGDLSFLPAAGGLVLAVLISGALVMRAEHLRPTFRAAALQGNIDADVPWEGQRPRDPAFVWRVMGTFTAQERQAAAQGVRLSVWPETAFPGYLRTDAQLRGQVAAEARRDRMAIVVGSNDYDPLTGKDANALFLVNPDGDMAGLYSKRLLVPFGEYVPFRRYLPFLDALHVTIYDRQAGPYHQPLLDAGPPVGRIGAAICYESSYGSLTREQVARGAGLLVVSTEDTWFGRTAAASQHAAMSSVRAAESDRYLVRCAATGISQIIEPTGRVIAEAGLFRPAVVVAPVESRSTLTLYVRWGDWFVGVCTLLLIGTAALSVRARRAGTAHSSGR